MSIPRKKIICFPKLEAKGTVVEFLWRTISCAPDGKMFAEKLAFYCLVTWGMRRRVLSCSLAASNYCTARNSWKTTVNTLLPSLADRLCFTIVDESLHVWREGAPPRGPPRARSVGSWQDTCVGNDGPWVFWLTILPHYALLAGWVRRYLFRLSGVALRSVTGFMLENLRRPRGRERDSLPSCSFILCLCPGCAVAYCLLIAGWPLVPLCYAAGWLCCTWNKLLLDFRFHIVQLVRSNLTGPATFRWLFGCLLKIIWKLKELFP